MKVATWNLARARPGGRRASALLSYMHTVDADVWVLTETWRDMSPGREYQLVACSSDTARDRDAGAGEVWVAVWSRLSGGADPLTTTDAERTAAVRLTTPSGLPAIVYGTVLPWLTDGRGPAPRGAASFCAALDGQRDDWGRLRRDSPEAELCVAGDFNQDLASSHYYGSARGRAALAHALGSTGLTCLTSGSQDPVTARGGRASIDHLCVTTGLTSGRNPEIDAWPHRADLGPRLTDHFGVAATLWTR